MSDVASEEVLVAKTDLQAGALRLPEVLMQSVTLVAPAIATLFSFGFIVGSFAGLMAPFAFAIVLLIALMLLGAAASLLCYGFVGSLKNRLRLDDSLDVFGIHGLGGIAGSIGTAIVAIPALGGHGGEEYALGWQLVRQLSAVGVAIAWSAAGSALCFALVRAVMPLRHARDAERERACPRPAP